MVTYKLYVNDKEETIQFPTSYSDLTYAQFLRLRTEYKGADLGHLLDILTGIPRSIWMNLPIAEANKVTQFLQWIVTGSIKWDKLPLPSQITYAGKVYDIPKDLGLETFGQKIVLEARLDAALKAPFYKPTKPEDFKTLVERNIQAQLCASIPYIVAVYMQPRVTGKPFDETEVAAVELEILNCRAVEVYPIGNFIIRSLLGSLKRGTQHLRQQAPSQKRGNSKKGRASKKSNRKRATS